MCPDDEEDSLTCYDQAGTSAPGEAAAEIINGLPGEAELEKITGLCPKCLLFWIVVIILVGGFLYTRKK